jgi:hypothetical protein
MHTPYQNKTGRFENAKEKKKKKEEIHVWVTVINVTLTGTSIIDR